VQVHLQHLVAGAPRLGAREGRRGEGGVTGCSTRRGNRHREPADECQRRDWRAWLPSQWLESRTGKSGSRLTTIVPGGPEGGRGPGARGPPAARCTTRSPARRPPGPTPGPDVRPPGEGADDQAREGNRIMGCPRITTLWPWVPSIGRSPHPPPTPPDSPSFHRPPGGPSLATGGGRRGRGAPPVGGVQDADHPRAQGAGGGGTLSVTAKRREGIPQPLADARAAVTPYGGIQNASNQRQGRERRRSCICGAAAHLTDPPPPPNHPLPRPLGSSPSWAANWKMSPHTALPGALGATSCPRPQHRGGGSGVNGIARRGDGLGESTDR